MKKLFSTLLLALIAVMAYAQSPVSWSFKLVDDNTANPKIEMTASINPGFHLYAVENPAGGSNPLEFYFDVKGAQLVGKPVAAPTVSCVLIASLDVVILPNKTSLSVGGG